MELIADGKRLEIKGVLFDNDGTLVDTHDMILASFRHATEQVLGRTFPDEMYMHGVGTPLADQMGDFTDDPAVGEELLAAYRAHNHAIHDEMIRAFPGIEEALGILRDRGINLGVVTSKLHPLAWRGLEVTGLAPYFDFLIGADDWPEHKPEPGPVLHGCELMGLAPESCVYVGDSPYDMLAGNGARTTTVAALWGMFPRESMLPTAPDLWCDTVADFVSLVKGA